MWTHSKTNDSYITVTAQFMDSMFTMQSVVLATRTVSEKHTSECIRECVKSILDEFGARRDDNVFVTDNAANMKAAFREHLWIG